MAHGKGLVDLMYDVFHDDVVRDRFKNDTAAVLADYDVAVPETEIRGRNWPVIADAIAKELEEKVNDAGLIPPPLW
jgi:hypothetical protein